MYDIASTEYCARAVTLSTNRRLLRASPALHHSKDIPNVKPFVCTDRSRVYTPPLGRRCQSGIIGSINASPTLHHILQASVRLQGRWTPMCSLRLTACSPCRLSRDADDADAAALTAQQRHPSGSAQDGHSTAGELGVVPHTGRGPRPLHGVEEVGTGGWWVVELVGWK